MPRFKIYGADETTGEYKTLTIPTGSPQEAELIARQHGMVIRRVVELEAGRGLEPQPHATPPSGAQSRTAPPRSGFTLTSRIIPEAQTTSGQVAQGILRAWLWAAIGVIVLFVVIPLIIGLAGR